MFKLNLKNFFGPADITGTVESRGLSTLDMAEELGKEDDLTLTVEDNDDDSNDGSEVEKTGKVEEESEDLTVEDEIEEELKEPEVDDDDVEVHVSRKAVLAKYPNLFKEFPHLDRAVYREQKFSELLPTLKDAQTAVEKAEQFDSLTDDLSKGNTIELLKSIKEEDADMFNNVVDNYLFNLREVDQNAYFHVLSTVLKNAAIAMSKSDDNDDKIAGKLLHKFIFNTDNITEPTKLGKGEIKDEKAEALAQKEKAFNEKILNTHVGSVNTKIHNIVTSAIDKNIDPKGSMNQFTREVAVEKCSKELQKAIQSDRRFSGLLDKLWDKAAQSDYSQESLDRIKSAYWSKAKGLLPDIIRKTRNTALKGLGTKSPNERNNPLPVGRPTSSTNKQERRMGTGGKSDKEKAREIAKGTRSVDYLMKD